MQDYVNELRSLVERATPGLLALSASRSVERPAPGKWSPREIIGHLIDSASNNHQRFVRAQFQDGLVFPGYEQDAWVQAQRYHDIPLDELVALWRAFNLHLARVMETAPESSRLTARTRHNLGDIAWQAPPASEPATLEYFMSDNVGHLKHHLRQIFGPDWH
jgi:hypothetical protein